MHSLISLKYFTWSTCRKAACTIPGLQSSVFRGAGFTTVSLQVKQIIKQKNKVKILLKTQHFFRGGKSDLNWYEV